MRPISSQVEMRRAACRDMPPIPEAYVEAGAEVIFLSNTGHAPLCGGARCNRRQPSQPTAADWGRGLL